VLDWGAIAARILVFAAALVLFGASGFFAYGLAPAAAFGPRQSRTWLRILLLIAASIALFGSALWLMSEAAALSGDPVDALNASAVWAVVVETQFGRVGAFRCAALVLSLITLLTLNRPGQKLWLAQAFLAAAVVASLAWTGHGSIDSGTAGWVHRGSDLLHLLAAGLWVGALVPICVMVLGAHRDRSFTSLRELAFGLNRFSAIGILVVAVLLLSGLVNSWFLIGPVAWRTMLSTLYGRLLLIKVILFAVMLALATVNRLRLAPKLQGAERDPDTASPVRGALRATLLTETALAMLVLGLVAVLGTLEPPISSN
jgi:putative copper resistance protein D